MNGLEEFLSFAAVVLNVNPAALAPESAYASIPEWDSVMHLRLLMEVEERYGVDIPLERLAEIKTLADFYAFIEK